MAWQAYTILQVNQGKLKVESVLELTVESHSQVEKYPHYGLVVSLTYQLKASVFDDLWMKLIIIQIKNKVYSKGPTYRPWKASKVNKEQ